MKRHWFHACFHACIAAALLAGSGLWTPAMGGTRVNVSVNVPLPGLFIPAPPALVVIPGTYVYYPPEVEADIFFYHGYWYRPHGKRWYSARGYNGPWRAVRHAHVPRAIFGVPPAYRGLPSRHERMPYKQVHGNWRKWERERHWDRADRGEGMAQRGYGRGPEQNSGHGRGIGHGK